MSNNPTSHPPIILIPRAGGYTATIHSQFYGQADTPDAARAEAMRRWNATDPRDQSDLGHAIGRLVYEPPGIVVTLAREHFINGLRFDPGRYRITRIGEGTNDVEF